MKPLNTPQTRTDEHATTQQCASACYPARQRVCHRSNTQGSSVSGQEQAQRREPLFSQRCKYSIEGTSCQCEYPPGTLKNNPSAGCAYPRDLRAGILQASDHWHPPGASPTHASPALDSAQTRASLSIYLIYLSWSVIFPRFTPGPLGQNPTQSQKGIKKCQTS